MTSFMNSPLQLCSITSLILQLLLLHICFNFLTKNPSLSFHFQLCSINSLILQLLLLHNYALFCFPMLPLFWFDTSISNCHILNSRAIKCHYHNFAFPLFHLLYPYPLSFIKAELSNAIITIAFPQYHLLPT